MVAFAQKEKIYTIEEYFALEEQSVQKHEFHNGKIIQMADETIPSCQPVTDWQLLIQSLNFPKTQ